MTTTRTTTRTATRRTTTRTTLRRAAAGVLTIALVVGAAVAGRNVSSQRSTEASTAPVVAAAEVSPGSADGPTPSDTRLPVTVAAAPAEMPDSLDVEPLVYDTTDTTGAAGTAPGVTGIGVPTLGAGTPVANPGGAVDLSADPEAAIAGDVPVGPGAASTNDPAEPSDPDAADSDALSTVTEIIASVAPTADALAGAPLGPPAAPGNATNIGAFVDPCVRDAPAGCGDGLEGVILGQIARPPLVTHWRGEVVSNSVYAGECRRQIPGLDFRTSTVFAIVINQPYSGTMNVQFFTAQADDRTPQAGSAVTAEVAPSSQLVDAWSGEYSSTRQTLQVPLCIRIDDVERNLGSCPGELLVSIGVRRQCRSQVELSVQGLDDLGHTWGAGLYRFWYGYDVSLDGGGNRASLRRTVRLTPIDERLIEVAVPIEHSAFGESTAPGRERPQRAQLVAAAAYPGRTTCAHVDPTRTEPIARPVSRQIATTRYWTPDPSQPDSREAVVLLNLPSALADGEAVVICVFWYTFDGASYDAPVVMAIERHEVIAPGRAVTEMRLLGFGEAQGWFSLPHATGPATRDPNLLRLSFLENSALNRRCGFAGPNGRSPVVTPLGDSSLVCRIDTPALFTEPRDELLYVELTGQLDGRDVASPMSRGQRTVRIDNRGCGPDGCGPVRRERWNLWDGRWVDLSFTRVPFATTAVLPNGLAYADGWDPNGWTIDSSGVVSETPTLAGRFPGFGADAVAPPLIDTSTLRLVRDAADPAGTLVLTWRANRLAQSTMVVRPRFAGSEAACPPVTSTPNTEFERSGRLVASGLCSGTQYVATLQLTDTTNGTDRRITEYAFDAGRNPGLAEDTARRVPPDDFDYAWSLAVSNPAGRGRVEAAVSDLVVRLGGYTLTSRPGTLSPACMPVEAATPIADGTRGADRVLGEVLVSVSLTLTGRTTPTEPGQPCGIGGDIVTRVEARWFAHWDGRSATLSQTLSDGTVVELTLRPISD